MPDPDDEVRGRRYARKLDALTLESDNARGFAWFQTPVSAELGFPFGAMCCDTLATTLRASGIVVRVANDQPWHVVAIAFSRPLADAALFRVATSEPATSTTGDNELTKQVAAWFPETGQAQLAKHASSSSTLVASGTATTEYATGAGAGKLAAAWDKLGIRASSIRDAKTFADGAIGLVAVDTRLPHGKKAAPMTLYAIVVRDGTTWKWVSLQWTTPLATPPLQPPTTNASVNTFTHPP